MFLLALGFLFSGKAEKIFNKKDCRYIVIDEVAGIFISLLFVPYSLKVALIGFFLFRIFDALKPFPAAKLQDLTGSAGIMLDDVIAGIYTNIVLQVVLRGTIFTGVYLGP